jgi:hypothetical protein
MGPVTGSGPGTAKSAPAPEASSSTRAADASALAAPADEARPRRTATEEDLIGMAEAVQKEVELLRGWNFKHPVAKGVYGETELRGFIERKLFEEQYGGGLLERKQAFLRTIGLIPRECDLRQTTLDVLLNQIGGFYDPDTKTFYMLKREGTDYGPLLNRTLVAHELTHALDDQYVDLNALIKASLESEDAGVAIGAVVEGSATALMTRYMAKAIQSGEFDMEELQRVLADEMERSQTFLESPPYFQSLVANYLCGMAFVVEGSGRTGDSDAPDEGESPVGTGESEGPAVLAATKSPPASSEQILHPEKYWDPSERDEPVLVSDADVSRTLAEYGLRYVVHVDTVGELLSSLLTAEEGSLGLLAVQSPSAWTNFASEGWGGDRFYLLSAGADETDAKRSLRDLRAVWITVWDSLQDRDEFVDAYEEHRPDSARRAVRLGARGAAFLYGFGGSTADAIARRLVEDSPAFTKAGEPWTVEVGRP